VNYLFLSFLLLQVEEIKAEEARELASLNKNYMELDLKCKKLDRKVSIVLLQLTISLFLNLE